MNMKSITKQKRLLKKEVFEELSSWDFSGSETIEKVNEEINKCGIKISEILSEYFLRWESIKEQRDGILKNLQNNYPDLSKNEIKKLIIEHIKEYWNSEEFREQFGLELIFSIDVEDSI